MWDGWTLTLHISFVQIKKYLSCNPYPKTEPPSAQTPVQAVGRSKEVSPKTDLGISDQLLYNWRRALQQSGKILEEQQLQQAEQKLILPTFSGQPVK